MQLPKIRKNHFVYFTLIIILLISIWAYLKPSKSQAEATIQNLQDQNSCEIVIPKWIKDNLKNNLNSNQVLEIVRNLEKEGALPPYYVTKREAREMGWTPGKPFNEIQGLKGKSIGGDKFRNFERRLPRGRWKEADLDYNGGRRNAKRFLYSESGRKYITLDHYETFVEVPACK